MSDPSAQVFNWPESAKLLCRKAGGDSLHFEVKKFLTGLDCKRVLVACSGGADSVFMLCQLWTLAETLEIELVVAHYNHRWRSRDSDEDAQFVKVMSRQLQCPFAMDACPKSERALTETSARSLRIGFLRAAAREYDCQCIAFGHQQNDILETQLQRLARGSGVDGLAAPRPVHSFDDYPTHVRPLLHLSASMIRKALQACSIAWREDVSNQDIGISRNALRHRVIPGLQDAVEHDVSKGAARSRTLLEEDAVALDQFARESLSQAFSGSETLERAMLRAVPRAITRRALTGWLSVHQLNVSLSAPAIDRLLDAIYSNKNDFRMSAGTFFVVIDTSTIRIESANDTTLSLEPCSVKAGESIVLSTGAILKTELVAVDETLRKRFADGTVNVAREAYIASTPEQIFKIRSRQPGDSFQPLGAPGSKKLKAWLSDRKIPDWERNLLPLVINDSGLIAWVPGFPPADNLKINTATKLALKLTYKTIKSL